jgi:hypothetical protein
MSKNHKLQEVKAISTCGIEIIIEQIYEKYLNTEQPEDVWRPLAKVVIMDHVIVLDDLHRFAHPRTEKIFTILKNIK